MVEEINKQIDELHLSDKFDDVFNLVQNNLENANCMENAEFLWRASRSYFDRAESKPTDKDWQLQNFTKSHELAKLALQKDDKNAFTHKVKKMVCGVVYSNGF